MVRPMTDHLDARVDPFLFLCVSLVHRHQGVLASRHQGHVSAKPCPPSLMAVLPTNHGN
jgi:hypothetical protein